MKEEEEEDRERGRERALRFPFPRSARIHSLGLQPATTMFFFAVAQHFFPVKVNGVGEYVREKKEKKNLYWNVSASCKRAAAARHSDCARGSCLPAHSSTPPTHLRPLFCCCLLLLLFFYKRPKMQGSSQLVSACEPPGPVARSTLKSSVGFSQTQPTDWQTASQFSMW